MKTTELKLGEILQLEAEVNGFVNPQTGEVISKGLISELIKFKTKYWLMQLSEDVVADRNKIEKSREELLKELGDTNEDGSIELKMYINEIKDEQGEIVSQTVNPKYIEFQEKFNSLLSDTKTITHKDFKLDDFDSVESGSVYPIFFKLISKDEA